MAGVPFVGARRVGAALAFTRPASDSGTTSANLDGPCSIPALAADSLEPSEIASLEIIEASSSSADTPDGRYVWALGEKEEHTSLQDEGSVQPVGEAIPILTPERFGRRRAGPHVIVRKSDQTFRLLHGNGVVSDGRASLGRVSSVPRESHAAFTTDESKLVVIDSSRLRVFDVGSSVVQKHERLIEELLPTAPDDAG